MNEVEKYIRSIVFNNVDISKLKDSDFINISDSKVVKEVMIITIVIQ